MIIDQHKIIFIHIPKTAGSSIKYFFGIKEPHNKHKTIEEIKAENFKAYNSYNKFAIVRNPYDRMISFYFWMINMAKDVYINASFIEFNEWIKDPFRFYNGDTINILNPQYTWVDETVKIIKFENLNKELNEFFGEKVNLPITNESNHKYYLEYYNTESLDIVYDKYKEDFKKFNYKKI